MNPDEAIMLFSREAAETTRIIFEGTYLSLSTRCDSPIEKTLLAAMLYRLDPAFGNGGDYEFSAMCGDYRWPKVAHPYDGVFLYPQAALGKYRADFLVMIQENHVCQFVCIECDGHDYHERNKKQAARDRSRDRWMTANGVTVLRFTGSEIFADAGKCAEEISEVVIKLHLEILRTTNP